MKILILIFCITLMNTASQKASANSIREIITETSINSPEVIQSRHLSANISANSNLSFIEKGFQLGIAYRWEFLGTDLRFAYGSTQYGQIKAVEDYNQNTGTAYHPATYGAEMIRPRNDQDSWTYTVIEPGISIESKLFYFFPQLTQKARFGFTFGHFQDEANNLGFSSFLFNIEAALLYQINPTSPWSVEGSLMWHSGNLMLNVADDSTFSSDRHLPLNWIGSSLGVRYSF